MAVERNSNMSISKRWLARLGVALVLALGGGGCQSSSSSSSTSSAGDVSVKASAPARPRIDRSVPELQHYINHPLPEANLIDIDGAKLPDPSFRQGKVVLVFVNPTCVPCNKEGEFLRTVIDKRKDVSFYGVATLGEKEESLKKSVELFPFKTFYDEGQLLTKKLGITRMPIKMFLQDGVIKETWGGASKNAEIQADFAKWLGDVE